MNPIMQNLYERKSVRAFLDKTVEPDVKAAILEAATQAPTAGNQQLYTILDVGDPALKEQLSQTCDHQPFIASAPIVLIFVADCSKWLAMYRAAGCEPRKPGAGDLMLAVADAWVAAQNAVVAAESFGLGSCYIGDIMENCEVHRELLHLPPYTFPCAMLVLGYPTQQQCERKKPIRIAPDVIVHENTYRTFGENELRAAYEAAAAAESRPNFDYERWIEAFCKRKYNSDFSREMSRSVDVYWEEYR